MRTVAVFIPETSTGGGSLQNGPLGDLDGLSQLCESSRLAAGDEHLAGDDLIQDEILPSRVQLRKHVVEKQHRLFAEFPAHQLTLGQLQADGGGAGLTLGAR